MDKLKENLSSLFSINKALLTVEDKQILLFKMTQKMASSFFNYSDQPSLMWPKPNSYSQKIRIRCPKDQPT